MKGQLFAAAIVSSLTACTLATDPAERRELDVSTRAIVYDYRWDGLDACLIDGTPCKLSMSGETAPNTEVWTVTTTDPAHFVGKSDAQGRFAGHGVIRIFYEGGTMFTCAGSLRPTVATATGCRIIRVVFLPS